ncbi:MFS general substrate transporter [Sodiomyces alkalinus F11]|uniref:MFS general substrate transporter n=1 Tax=Sodiomyces alkalinus (strain CBS 110278 / VKM F-3762 / F11) TaxID=1314773 RepID=A0A3N2PWV3_SODAK|nr:MFS general substrate transporter [Sodiomyces alkalinus F11]ROT39001.1 MFS general substrate transporter [Sodiomyces alkalinus F11]
MHEKERGSSDDVSRVATLQASVHANEDAHLTLWESFKKYRRAVMHCIFMTSAILLYGYDYVIIGTVTAMPSFQHDFGELLGGEWIFPSLWFGLWAFISPGLQMVGALLGGKFQDRFGRRASLAMGSLLCAVGVAVCFVSNLPNDIDGRRGMFLAGKGIQGGAIGTVMVTAMTYMSEILPPNLRGPVLAFFPIFTLLGQLIGALVIFASMDRPDGYVLAFASQWPFSALALVAAIIIPESPTYLVRRNHEEQALKAQRRLGCIGGDPEQTLERIRADIAHERRLANATYQDSFRKPNRRRTFIIMFANTLPQLFGLTLLSKGSYFLQVVGLSPDMSVLILIIGVVCGLIANILSILALASFGRRPLILTTLSIAAVLWASTGIAGIFRGTVAAWYTAASLVAISVVCGLGAWPASQVVAAETSALHLRGKAQGIGWFTSGAGYAVFGLVLPYMFNPDQGNLRGKTGFVFAGLCVLAAAVSFLYVPEMKGRTAAEIDRMFEQKLSAREFAKWKNPNVPENGE